MHKNKFVFAQLTAFLDRNRFNRIVAKYNGDKYVKHFTCWNQLLALMFGQLSINNPMNCCFVREDKLLTLCCKTFNNRSGASSLYYPLPL